MAKTYDFLGVYYNNCKEINDLFDKYTKDPETAFKLPLSENQIIDFLNKSTPQEKILLFGVYTFRAQIPKELQGIYSEADYPPAPAE